MKSLVEYPRSFGYMGRIYTSWYEGYEDQSQNEQMLRDSQTEAISNSIDLLLTLFPSEFTEGKINDYISQLESLKYLKEQKEYAYKEQVLVYMKSIISIVKASKK
jgi:hypothetical protein